MKKNITLVENTNEVFKSQQLTIGIDLGDRTSHYCVLDEAGNVILEQSVATTPKGIQQVFSKISRSRIAPGNRDTFALAKPAADAVGP